MVLVPAASGRWNSRSDIELLPMRTRRLISIVFFLLPAVFHAWALTWPEISVPESPETHLLFVFVNLWFANEVLTPTPRFWVALVALTLHQYVVHGFMFATALARKELDIQSVIVLASLMVVWELLLKDQVSEHRV